MQSQLKSVVQQDGFMVIEVLVTILVLSVFTFIIACYQSMSIRASHDAIARWKAVNAVHSFLVKASIDPSLLAQKNGKEDEYAISCTPLSLPIYGPSEFNVSQKNSFFKVTASWQGSRQKNSFACIAGVMT